MRQGDTNAFARRREINSTTEAIGNVQPHSRFVVMKSNRSLRFVGHLIEYQTITSHVRYAAADVAAHVV